MNEAKLRIITVEYQDYKISFFSKSKTSINIYNDIFKIYCKYMKNPSPVGFISFCSNIGEVFTLTEGNKIIEERNIVPVINTVKNNFFTSWNLFKIK